MLCLYSDLIFNIEVKYFRPQTTHWVKTEKYLKHNWIDAGELCLFSVKILNGTLK